MNTRYSARGLKNSSLYRGRSPRSSVTSQNNLSIEFKNPSSGKTKPKVLHSPISAAGRMAQTTGSGNLTSRSLLTDIRGEETQNIDSQPQLFVSLGSKTSVSDTDINPQLDMSLGPGDGAAVV